MIDILTIAGLTIREAYRRAILWVALALSALFLLVYGVGFYYAHLDMLRYTRGVNVYSDTAFNFILMAGFYVVAFLGVVIAVLMSVGSLSGEIASHTIQSLATKPIRRGSLVLGKWLGLAGMLAAFLVVLSAGLVAVTWGISGYVPPRVVRGVALIVLQALVMLSLGLAASARLSTVANGVLVFLLYGVAFVGGGWSRWARSPAPPPRWRSASSPASWCPRRSGRWPRMGCSRRWRTCCGRDRSPW